MLKDKISVWYKKNKDAIIVIFIAALIVFQTIEQISKNIAHQKIIEQEVKIDKVNHQELCQRIQTLEMTSKGFLESGYHSKPCNFLLPDEYE